MAASARRLADQGAEGLVISLIHAYRDPSHERRARAVAEAAAPGVPVSTSHEVWPEAREYERTALAVLDAYVQPKVRRYLEGFEAALRARAVPAVAHVTKSNGGIMPVAAARRQTVATLLSGPASGVIGAAYVAGAAGLGEPHHPRRGRDERGHRGGGGRPPALQHGRADRRHPRHDAGGGRHRDRRGRRLRRLGRRGRRAQGGPAEHRRQSRPGVL